MIFCTSSRSLTNLSMLSVPFFELDLSFTSFTQLKILLLNLYFRQSGHGFLKVAVLKR